MYKEQNVKIDKPIAGLLCAAILSDTLAFKSPTCTFIDEAAAKELARLAEIDIYEFATSRTRPWMRYFIRISRNSTLEIWLLLLDRSIPSMRKRLTE